MSDKIYLSCFNVYNNLHRYPWEKYPPTHLYTHTHDRGYIPTVGMGMGKPSDTHVYTHTTPYQLLWVTRILSPAPQELKSLVCIILVNSCGCPNLCSELHSSPDIPIKNQKPTSGTCYINFDVVVWMSSLELWSTHPCPINPARLAGTEKRNDAITKWIRSQIEHHPDFILYLQLQTKLQTMSEVLNQYRIVSRMLGLLSGLMTPVSYDGAPSCMVKMVRFNFRSMCMHWTNDWHSVGPRTEGSWA